MTFDFSSYQNKIISEIQSELNQHQKLYLEIVGNITDQSDFSYIIPNFPKDARKKIFCTFKYDLDIFFCIRAEDILDEEKQRIDNKNFQEFLFIYLKKIENHYGIKPHIIINGIDIENMYDVIFSFETYFQKAGYRVREKYKIKAYETPINKLLSENGFGNDDHIPTNKKLILIGGLTPESGKLTTAMAQIYQDGEIGINSVYAKLDPVPDYEGENSNRNIAAKALDICTLHTYGLDSILSTRDVINKSKDKFGFIKNIYNKLSLSIPQNIKEYTIGNLDINNEDIKPNLIKFLQENIEKSDSSLLQEKLIGLKEQVQ